jgi:DNA-binding XRE family transcriptional regulator
MVLIFYSGISERFREDNYTLSPDDYKIRKGIPALPFSKVERSLNKSLKHPELEEIKTFGDHIRKMRTEMNMFQKQLANLIGVSEDTITNWENNRAQPHIRNYPKIIEFLGYFPF